MEFIQSITTGQWALIWIVCGFIAHCTTGWKEGMEGCLGFFIYLIVTIISGCIFLTGSAFIFLWDLAA